ncbi:MAG: hypothetical protein J6Q55_01150, partial [Clostridia bacterium]|nr:hypothetical protein [Clostridia bacterium]
MKFFEKISLVQPFLNSVYYCFQSSIVFFFDVTHTSSAFFKSVFSEFYAANPQCLEDNVRHRFRNKEQYSAAELHHLLAVKQG